jgi:alkylhydroperoxidase family enzyme
MFAEIPDHARAWAQLPPALAGQGQPLPAWARLLSCWLPRATAALLQLDLAQRAQSPLEAPLRAAMRWMAAQENRCPFGMACAEADLRRAGASDSMIAGLRTNGRTGWSSPQRLALEFALQMTRASDAVTDDDFQRLVEAYGPCQTALMVLHTAYANFHDRLLHCLGAAGEEHGPGLPAEVLFSSDCLARETTAARAGGTAPPATVAQPGQAPERHNWPSRYDALQAKLEAQRQKRPRLPIPQWGDVARNVPAELFPRPSKIVWYLVVLGYAPELAVPFELFMRTLAAEAAPAWDRIMGGSLFWVTTQAVNCPYCMGHCEMNWEVAGLSAQQIAARSRLLAWEDWSTLPPGEQRAYQFARKLSARPWEVSVEEIEGLRHFFGDLQTVVMLVNASRYHYMTRISNGFQLTLERENPFFDYYGVSRETSP